MSDHKFKYVFGPALSRRLGRSLGVDLLPFKTCTYDCTYCQLGPTTHCTAERREYVPLEDVLTEVRLRLASGVAADCISLVGSGEPTLYAPIGELIDGIKSMTDIPLVVITNGSLLWDPDVRDGLARADLVIPSLDAGDEGQFRLVNRPAPSLRFDTVIDGLVAFRDEFLGEIWLEVFLLGGLTAEDPAMDRLAAHIGRIRPDKVQLNTVARPAPGSGVTPVPRDVLEACAARLGPNAEVIARYDTAAAASGASVTAADVLGVIRRHPCNADDLAQGLGIHRNEVLKHVGALLEDGALEVDDRDGAAYYMAKND
ncbi:MAG: radical SAM protein [Nitrospiraceae bacterium]|nr:radical SAM protein [Nitrospiraceae bacterium]